MRAVILRLLIVCATILASCSPDHPKAPPARVLFIGNSITLHGASPTIGWYGEYGMAASSAEKDYVHLVAAALRAESFEPFTPGQWESSYTSFDYSSVAGLAGADILIVKLGENVSPYLPSFRDAFAELLRVAASHEVVVVSTWWTDPYFAPINADMKAAAEAAGASWVELPEHDASHNALDFTNPGVAAHPGDRGMQLIADAILAALERKGWTVR